MDNDVPGQNAKIILAKELSKYHKNIYVYNFKGINQKDFSKMKEEGVNFQLNKRLRKWNLQTEILLKTGDLI